ncbi:hypothetical protein BD410DRAFT_786994 [Rickenella mellea]|uniref:Large ribosomal subunit protein uL23m n=1 Tax=Rickenella mellea TaxID=50990 RepID=A0A4Y7Q8F5_9AGAM|nr:hypothetical protein BD410DRAFT_786994 [Rickenella mellea]
MLPTGLSRLVSQCACRTYATIPEHPVALKAYRASSPLNVREQHARLFKELGRKHGRKDGDNPELAALKDRIRAHREKVAETAGRRGRIRGIRRVKGSDGKLKETVVGERIYFPNIIFRMVRNHTPPGQPYNPYEATFRIPQSITKTDIRGYLNNVYGVKTTYIRTDNYLPKIDRRQGNIGRDKKVPYKRAIVGLVDPFYYPLAMEDMTGKERLERMGWLEQRYNITAEIKSSQSHMVEEWMRQKTGNKKWKIAEGDEEEPHSRKAILRRVLERREIREQKIKLAKSALAEMRQRGPIIPPQPPT